MKKVLTDRTLKSLKAAPKGKRYMVWDATVPSFGVRVTDRGRMTFVVMRRLNGKLLRRALGEYPITTLRAAREAASEALGSISQGVDPKAAQQTNLREEENRKRVLFGAVAEEFIARHVVKLKSKVDVSNTIRHELIYRWGSRPLSMVSRRDVIQLLEEVTDSGRIYIAYHLLAYTRKLFNWAISRDLYGIEVSPCDRISAKDIIGQRAPRQRVLNDAELRWLWNVTEEMAYPFGPFIRLLMLTGQRLREVAKMTWSEIDLATAIWTIPAERMKGDAAHEVPLAPIVVDILRELPRFGEPHVLTTTDGLRPISGFSKAKDRADNLISERAAGAIPPWRFHDLRRTMRTHLGGLPVPDLVAELVIAHAKPGLHRVYDLHEYRDEKRLALELWANRLQTIVQPQL